MYQTLYVEVTQKFMPATIEIDAAFSIATLPREPLPANYMMYIHTCTMYCTVT